VSEVSTPSLVSLLLSSAAIGALVSAGIAALSSWRERVSRRKELLLSLCVQMAIAVIETHIKTVEMSGENAQLYPTVVMARWHQKQLKGLFDKEHLTDDLEKDFSDFIHKSHKDLQ
jgi:hypothetical protein